MGADQIDDYLAGVPEPQRSTLEAVRATILRVVPDAEQTISYGMPAFRFEGKVVAGFAANKKFNSYYPFSGRTLGTLKDELADYSQTLSALHFPMDTPLDERLVAQLIAVRQAEITGGPLT